MVSEGAVELKVYEKAEKHKNPIHISPPAQDNLNTVEETTENKASV